jgi:acetyl-CoA synthetase
VGGPAAPVVGEALPWAYRGDTPSRAPPAGAGRIRGRAVEMYVSLKPGYPAGKEMEQKVTRVIETEIGKIARPKSVWIVPDMPKTRSGKIMRRVIASVSNFADVGDITTLANPEVVDGITQQVQSAKVAKGEVPRELTEQELAEIRNFGAE